MQHGEGWVRTRRWLELRFSCAGGRCRGRIGLGYAAAGRCSCDHEQSTKWLRSVLGCRYAAAFGRVRLWTIFVDCTHIMEHRKRWFRSLREVRRCFAGSAPFQLCSGRLQGRCAGRTSIHGGRCSLHLDLTQFFFLLPATEVVHSLPLFEPVFFT